jgi:hypothetical protein
VWTAKSPVSFGAVSVSFPHKDGFLSVFCGSVGLYLVKGKPTFVSIQIIARRFCSIGIRWADKF